MGGATGMPSFVFMCPGECGARLSHPGTPVSHKGSWPKAVCVTCHSKQRIGKANLLPMQGANPTVRLRADWW
eukprot:8811370-Alexandrium_andersonii.AAC.1